MTGDSNAGLGEEAEGQGCGVWGRADMVNAEIDGESYSREVVLSSAPGITS